MNRWDEIQATARDIASNIHSDPEKVTAMADDLIKLCGLMIGAVGKAVAIDGESSISDPYDDSAHARYLTGERIQDAARSAVDEASSAGCDLERWRRVTPGTGCRCGHVPSVHQAEGCTGERFNNEPCKGGPCTGFVVREPEGGWTYTDRRPVMFRHMDDRGALYIPPELAARCPECNSVPDVPHAIGCPRSVPATDNYRCSECNRIECFGHWHGCSRNSSDSLLRAATPAAPRCKCCGGPCAHNMPQLGSVWCCFPLGSVCPIHG